MLATYFQSLGLILLLGFVTWLYSVYRSDVSMVDSLWSLMFLAAALLFYLNGESPDLRSGLILMLVGIWALRLSIHLTVRNWGEPEDRRYQEIRKNNSLNFTFKSLYFVFGLQGLLAWIISISLLFALYSAPAFSWLDLIAVTLWFVGFFFEAIADWQLLQFKRSPSNKGKVLSSGLWHYSRHPNYFGEFLIWWGFYFFALSAGGWWTIYAPLLMTMLLLKISGVGLMEKGIEKRRPEYRAYIEQTNAFIPAPLHKPTGKNVKEATS